MTFSRPPWFIDLMRWVANTITRGDLVVAEDDAQRAARNLVWMNDRLAKEQAMRIEEEKQFRRERRKMADRIRELREDKGVHRCPEATAEAVVERMLRRPIAWVDRSKMDLATLRAWGGHARSLLDNPLFQALCGRVKRNDQEATTGELAKDIIEHIAKQSRDHQETRDLRMTMNGIELVRERAEKWLYSEQEVPNTDPNAPM